MGAEQSGQEQHSEQRLMARTDTAYPMHIKELLEGLSHVIETRIQTELEHITQHIERGMPSQGANFFYKDKVS